jgi:hypothetical protein
MSIFKKSRAVKQKVVRDLNEEVSDTLKAFKERSAQEAKRFQDATDSEYWFAVCFQTREDKERFLKEFLPKLGDKYLDGRKVEDAIKKARR